MADYPADKPEAMDLGDRHFVMPNGHGGYMWWHDCPAVEHISWGWFGPNGDQASGHIIVTHDPLTVQGSLVCEACRDHGFIRGGRWVRA